MAGETLQTAAQLLAGYPDNSQGIIQALNTRQHVVSGVLDVANVFEVFDPTVTVAVTTDPIDTILNTFWTAPAIEAFQFWNIDGNGRLFPDYQGAGVAVDPGTFRLVDIEFLMLMSRQPTGIPSTFGGNYQYKTSNTAPASGEISGNSNLTEHRVNYTDRDANDLTAQWQGLQADDVVNIGGVLYKILTFVQNANDLLFTHDSLSNQTNQTGGDQLFVQGLGDDKHDYRIQWFIDGVATGTGLTVPIGGDPVLINIPRPLILDYAPQPLIDIRIGKEIAAAPDLNLHALLADIRGTLI